MPTHVQNRRAQRTRQMENVRARRDIRSGAQQQVRNGRSQGTLKVRDAVSLSSEAKVSQPKNVAVKVQPWGGGKNDSLESILKGQGYSQKEIYAKDKNGSSLLDRVTSSNNLKNANLVRPGQELNIPTRPQAGGTGNANASTDLTRSLQMTYSTSNSRPSDERNGDVSSALGTGGEISGAAADASDGAARSGARAADATSDAVRSGARALDVGTDAARGLGDFARGAGRVLGPAAVGADLLVGGLAVRDAWNDNTLTDRERDQRVGEATTSTAGAIAGGAGGAWAGAAAGAAIGSVVPVVGTVAGGLIGAVVGGVIGGRGGEAVGGAVGRTGVGRGVGDFVNDLFGR